VIDAQQFQQSFCTV